jgi:hypothetical protein
MPSLDDIGISLIFSRLVNVLPKVSKSGDLLVATSDWKSQIWCLGFGGRKVIVDPTQKIVRLLIRRFWFFRTSRRIEFDWIQEVLYGYYSTGTGWGAYQESDLFNVGLQLKNGESLTLFRFFGEGDFVNNSIWPDWMYWEDRLVANYTRGDQERQSLLYADLVARMIGVPVGNPPD